MRGRLVGTGGAEDGELQHRQKQRVQSKHPLAISISSVATPSHLPSSPVTSSAACWLIRPNLAVPRITGMNKVRLTSITFSSVKYRPCICATECLENTAESTMSPGRVAPRNVTASLSQNRTSRLIRLEYSMFLALMVPLFMVSSKLLHRHVSRLLLHPILIRVRRESCQAHPASLQVDEEKHIVGQQPLERQDFRRKEVHSDQNVPGVSG
jgi:hypothetical protein